MYKPKYVTRTIKTKEVSILWLDISTNQTHVDDVLVPGHLSSEDKIIEYVKMYYDTIPFKPVHIVSVLEKEALYKMPEEAFMEHAEIVVEHNKEGEDK